MKREPDFTIIHNGVIYLRRWWILPRNRFFNIYLHNILRSDEDRALHDHPWWNVSILLKGGYVEHTPDGKFERKAGNVVFRKATAAHRLQLNHFNEFDGRLWIQHEMPCWSLFITGPRVREWGFHCPKGWKSWREFLGIAEGKAKGDEKGPGCDD